MTNKSSTTKQAIIDGFRFLSNKAYNVLASFDSDRDAHKHANALKTYDRLVSAGYSKEAAIKVIKEAFLIDLKEHV